MTWDLTKIITLDLSQQEAHHLIEVFEEALECFDETSPSYNEDINLIVKLSERLQEKTK